MVNVGGPGSGIQCFDFLFAFRVEFDDDNEMFDKVVSETDNCLMSAQ